MTPLQSLIKDREEAFDEKFLDSVNDCVVDYGGGINIKSFNRTTIRKTLEAVREMCEGMKLRPTHLRPKTHPSREEIKAFSHRKAYSSALSDLSSHLTEELDNMEGV